MSIVPARKANVPHRENVEAGQTAKYTPNDVLIEVFIGEELRASAHPFPTRRASNRSRTPAEGNRASISCSPFRMSRLGWAR